MQGTQHVSQTALPLDVFFSPKNVAVIGATEKPGSVGRTVFWNLISSPFGGAVFPVNPTHSSILGVKAYKSVAEVPDKIDLAVVVTPPPTVRDVIRQCGEKGVKGAVIISAGFKEIGPEGVKLEQDVLEEARRWKMRLIGPNCLGVMSPLSGLNATFAASMAKRGNVGFLSQSGALCTAVLDWSLKANVGFSCFASIGSMLDVGWGDLIDYLGQDPHTASIVIYMETIGDARAFLSAAREVALTKPIIVIKAGRTAAAAKAAASHTGSLAGSDEVLDAAFRRTGVLRVNSISDLFDMADVLAKQPNPKGPKLTILTNAGGPGVLATDALITGGGELAELAPRSVEALNGVLPPTWSHGNPIDIIGDAPPERYAKAIELVANDPQSDGLLVVLTPQSMTDPTLTAEKIAPYARVSGKPILASWMGADNVAEGTALLSRAGIPTFAYPDMAVKAFNYMWRYSYNLKGLYETPSLHDDGHEAHAQREAALKIINGAREAGRTILTETESKQLINAYRIPTVQTVIARDETSAVEAAVRAGFPVVLKLHSETITHKTDVGGVQLNLQNEAEVRAAWRKIKESVAAKAGPEHFQGVAVQPMVRTDGYEIIVGSSIDAQFGPVLLFGSGGQLVEVYKDRALALPPLNTTLARRMMEQTKIFKALLGVRGRKPVDMAALEALLVRFSTLVIEQPWIKEIDINPLLVSGDRIIALDARVVLHDASTDQLPRPAIRPYPAQYVGAWKMKNKMDVTIRPIRPEDEPLMVKFHEQLSDRSVLMRYLEAVSLKLRVSHERLMRNCFIDYDREMALVAEHAAGGETEILGVARMKKSPLSRDAQFALLVHDRLQGQGLGKELLRRLLEVARDEKIHHLCADILTENQAGIDLCAGMGFQIIPHPGENRVTAMIEL